MAWIGGVLVSRVAGVGGQSVSALADYRWWRCLFIRSRSTLVDAPSSNAAHPGIGRSSVTPVIAGTRLAIGESGGA
jgi:hypothetical protein